MNNQKPWYLKKRLMVIFFALSLWLVLANDRSAEDKEATIVVPVTTQVLEAQPLHKAALSVTPDLASPKITSTPAPIATIESLSATPIPQVKPVLKTPTPKITTKQTPGASLSNDNYYINSQGNKVQSPAFSDSIPAGASARCKDDTYSFSQSRRGTCSHHGGVAAWL